jgi:type IV secretion system protein VirB11
MPTIFLIFIRVFVMILHAESQKRLYDKLHEDLGKINNFLEDISIDEIMLNPNGTLWIDHVSKGVVCVDTMSRSEAFSIIYTVAGIHGLIVSHQNPRVETELPSYRQMSGERFTAQIPPIVSSPSFCIRKRSKQQFTLKDYLRTERITQMQFKVLCELIRERKNILVCGGPGTGKTTVTNALISEAVRVAKSQRFLLLEDVPELQCAAENHVSMLTSREVDMTSLLRDAMRMRPDRILIGEVRGKEALDMLKAWNTGCPGGICTVHANGAKEAIQRILDLSMEAGLIVPPINLVRHTIDAVVSVVRQESEKGFVKEIISLGDDGNGEFLYKTLA